MLVPPEMVLMRPFFSSWVRSALFLVTLSATLRERCSMVLATRSLVEDAKAILGTPHSLKSRIPWLLRVDRDSVRSRPAGIGGFLGWTRNGFPTCVASRRKPLPDPPGWSRRLLGWLRHLPVSTAPSYFHYGHAQWTLARS